jgi:hypothetical protein
VIRYGLDPVDHEIQVQGQAYGHFVQRLTRLDASTPVFVGKAISLGVHQMAFDIPKSIRAPEPLANDLPGMKMLPLAGLR